MAPPRRLSVSPGERFGGLVVVAELDGCQPRAARCACDCGTVVAVPLKKLRSGGQVSCGCRRRERLLAMNVSVSHPRLSHGLSEHPHYDRWCGMMARCHNPESKDWPNYGGRGIAVCQEWHDPAAFIDYADRVLGPMPSGHTIDRINNDGDYEPGNVRWADYSTQNRNRRRRRAAVGHDMRIQ